MDDTILLLRFANLKYCLFLLNWKSVISGEIYPEFGICDVEQKSLMLRFQVIENQAMIQAVLEAARDLESLGYRV